MMGGDTSHNHSEFFIELPIRSQSDIFAIIRAVLEEAERDPLAFLDRERAADS